MRRRRQTGNTFIEFLISISISSILAIIAIYSFVMLRQIYNYQHALSVIQENARFLHFYLSSQITQSGNFGCNSLRLGKSLSVESTINSNEMGTILTERLKSLTASEFLSHPLLNSYVQKNVQGDVLWVKHVSEMFELEKVNPPYLFIHSQSERFHPGRIVALTDCQHIELKRLQSEPIRGQGTLGLEFNDLKDDYLPTTQVGILSSNFLYVAPTSRLNSQHKPIFALYSYDLNQQRKMEILDGVEQMNISYRINGKSELLKSTHIKDWSQVNQVNVQVLLSSNEPLTSTLGFVSKKTAMKESQPLKKEWNYVFPIDITL